MHPLPLLLAFPLNRDVLRVNGPDAVAFLQGQLSQDVEGLAEGSSAESLVLQPQGKVDAYLRVTRTGADELLLDVEEGFGDAVLARLARFKLRTKADLQLDQWPMVALRGAGARDIDGPDGVLAVPVSWPGVEGLDLLGPDARIPDGIEIGTTEQFDALRIQAGVPAMGRELDERTIPAEAGIVEQTVSFTKGCFTGQELVARIDSRGGNVPRRLRGLTLADGGPPAAGSAVVVEGREVGTITSAAATGEGGAVALAYIRRDVDPPAAGEVLGRAATIAALPLIS